MEDKDTNTGQDISIEDILEDPSLDDRIGAVTKKSEKKEIKPEVQPVVKDEAKPEVQPVSISKEEEEKAKIKEAEDILKEESLDDALMPLTSSIQEEEDKIISPPTMAVVITNDADELLEGAESKEELIKKLMEDPTKNDNLCSVLKQENNTGVLLGHVMNELAEEIAYLKAYRKIHYISGEDDVSDISLKRTKSLETLVKALVEKDKLKHGFEGKIDFYGEKFEKIMEFVLNVVKESFEKVGIPDQFNDIFFVQLAQDLEGFEKKVEKIYYGTPQPKSSK